MDLELTGKRAWVVGASSGLGKAIATSLVGEGVATAISSRNASSLGETANALREHGTGKVLDLPLDVTDKQAIEETCDKVASELGGLDILISNSGGPPPGTFENTSEEVFMASFDLLLGSAFRLTKAALPYIKRQGGTIVYITSSGTKEVLPNLWLSNTMRAGVVGMAKTLSKEVASHGVRVVCVAPGRIATDRVAKLDAAAADRQGVDIEKVRATSISQIPLGRYGDPRELGDVVAFLVSPRASYVTGTTILVDGGRLSTIMS